MFPGGSSHCFKFEFLHRSQHHTAFLSPAKATGGRPCGGLACVFKRDIHLPSPVLFYSDKFFSAVRVGSIVFINSYLPYEGYLIRSLAKFGKACGLLKNLVNQALLNSLQYIIVGDLNIDINRSSVRSELLFECLPSYRVVPKSHNFSKVHHSGSTSDIDHIICSLVLSLLLLFMLTSKILTTCQFQRHLANAIPKSAHTGTFSTSYQLLMECYSKVSKSSYQHGSGATSWSSLTLPTLTRKKLNKEPACSFIGLASTVTSRNLSRNVKLVLSLHQTTKKKH